MEATRFAPVPAGERLGHLDVVRGCALLGVLVMNVQYHFRGPAERYFLTDHPDPGLLNGTVDDLLRLLVESRAMALFCMLFAVGLALQLERKEARGDGGFWPFAWRRMGALFGIGLLHVVFLWQGDILTTYAVAGVLLFPFLRRRRRTIVLWLAALFGLMAAAVVVLLVVRTLMRHGALDAQRSRAAAQMGEVVTRSLETYLHSGWWDLLLFRVDEWLGNAAGQLPPLLETFLGALLGLGLWRSGLLAAPGAHRPALRRAALWLVGAGLPASVVSLYWRPLRAFAAAHAPWGLAVGIPAALCREFGYLLLALGYGALLLLAWQAPRGRALLAPFAWAGRMALTLYLTQSLAMTALFYGWGLGLFGRVGPAAGLGLALLFFALQVLASRWWLQRFRFGPAEWLWRSLSYASRQPFRAVSG